MTISPTARHPLRIAFADIASTNWTAGSVYYKNLFSALGHLDDGERPEIVLVVTDPATEGGYDVYRDLADDIVRVPEPRDSLAVRELRRISRRLGRPNPARIALQKALDASGVDVMFASWGNFRSTAETPTLGWIHDFQHVHYPEFFGQFDLDARDRMFRLVAARSQRVVLSSEDARADYARFVPEFADKGRVLHFVAQPPADAFEHDAAAVCAEYYLPDRFLYLPNQFWIHKGHHVVIDALAELRVERPEITVVCTGNPADARDPLHFGQLLATAARKGVRDTFVLLGWVPHEDIFRLMRQSIAVLQPSLFEGWSTTVEETKSVGKSIVLSDIPIHREQAPSSALWFDPRDPSALAQRMIEAYDRYRPGPDEQLEAAARAALPARMRSYADTFMSIAREAIARQSA